MQTGVKNCLSDLITLSDNADQIILDSNFSNDQVGIWFSIIKETANAIVKGTFTGSGNSSCFTKDDLPSLVTLSKGKQKGRVSTLLAEVQKDRMRLSHRRSRKSLRKIVLGKKSGNQWKISTRKSSVKGTENNVDENTSTPKIKDKLLDSQFKSPLSLSNNKNQHSKRYFADSASSSKANFSTPVQCTDVLAPNTDEASLMRSNLNVPVRSNKDQKENTSLQNSHYSETKTPVGCSTVSIKLVKIPSQITESSSVELLESSANQVDEFLTPGNKTITIESDGSSEKNNYNSPVTRSKRKSSVQHAQENAKRIKCAKSSSQAISSKWDDNFNAKNTFKQININPVIPAKKSAQQNQTQPEKRILREIQKKEEKVSQNARKLRSLQKIKIEENKKAREKKMEKVMQQRKKMEKEKEERIRSRTESKQKHLSESEVAPKIQTQMKVESVAVKNSSKHQREDNSDPPQKLLHSYVKKVKISPTVLECNKNTSEFNKTYIHDPSKGIANTCSSSNLDSTYVCNSANVDNNSTSSSTMEKAPPKPIRNAKKQNRISGNQNTPNDNANKEAIKKPVCGSLIKESTSSKATSSTYLKHSAYSGKDKYGNISSTPDAKKVESKINLAKTPVSNNAKKPNSYVMTPDENSFVNYDISAIKSDDSDDEDEEKTRKKPIPAWALGINLRTALLKQHYAPLDVNELFGNCFSPPELTEIMGMEKKHYYKRTSSAIWLDSPNRSRTYYT